MYIDIFLNMHDYTIMSRDFFIISLVPPSKPQLLAQSISKENIFMYIYIELYLDMYFLSYNNEKGFFCYLFTSSK
jgi:hypothetical protein